MYKFAIEEIMWHFQKILLAQILFDSLRTMSYGLGNVEFSLVSFLKYILIVIKFLICLIDMKPLVHSRNK